ncbi:MAG: hypothetical protein ACE37B_09755 [Ilumatobacter sp.]|uniref:hypothetical protein n=1 Tax=Ilumatobacter sp. TaxID=1967498 RepID=UPI00391DFC9C
MTSLHASPDRRFGDSALLDTPGLSAESAEGTAAAASPADRRTFRASSLQEAIEIAATELGGDVTVVEANRIRRGGLGGFFATDLGVEVIVTRNADSSRQDGVGAGAANAVDRLLGRFDERDGDRFTPSAGVVAMDERSATDRAVARGRQLGAQAVGDEGFDTAPTTSMDRRSFEFGDDAHFEFGDDAHFEFGDGRQRSELADPVSQTSLAAMRTDVGSAHETGIDVDPVVDVEAAARGQAGTDDTVQPVAAPRHPFADLLEQELRSMSSETSETSDTAAVSDVAPRLGSETDLVAPPLDSPAPIVEPVSTEPAPTAPAPTELVSSEPAPTELVSSEPREDHGALDPEERSAEDALADLDALLASAGVELDAAHTEMPSEMFDDDPTPTLAPRPTDTSASVPSTEALLDLTDRLADQLSSVDRLASSGDGLRRMQVKISAPDGSLVEMQAEWGERG